MSALDQFNTAFAHFTGGAYPRDFKGNPKGFASVLNRAPESLRKLWHAVQAEAKRQLKLEERPAPEVSEAARKVFEPLGPRRGVM